MTPRRACGLLWADLATLQELDAGAEERGVGPDLLVSAAVSEAVENAQPNRPLGSRGSRGEVAGADPAELTPTATAVLAAIPAWWKSQASAAGLTGRWLDVEFAVRAEPPVALPADPPLGDSWGELTPGQVGAAYVGALSEATRARHGRHYTPRELASQLWAMARRSLDLSPGSQLLEVVPLPVELRWRSW